MHPVDWSVLVAFVVWQLGHIVFDLFREDFGGFKRRNIVFRYLNGNIPLDVTTHFFLPFFNNEASKASNIDVLTAGKRAFDGFKELF